jgi:hypothetical protein
MLIHLPSTCLFVHNLSANDCLNISIEYEEMIDRGEELNGRWYGSTYTDQLAVVVVPVGEAMG